jgi:hypothetical protein
MLTAAVPPAAPAMSADHDRIARAALALDELRAH